MPAKRLFAALLLAFILVPAALADGGPSPGALEGGLGVLGGGVRYVTIGSGRTTLLEAVRPRGGKVTGWVSLPGVWGVPSVSYSGTTGGLARNGGTLVLEPVNPFTCSSGRCAWSSSRFAVYTPATLRRRATVVVKGQFSYDALSPDGRTLYLIQHVSLTDQTRYLVRAYDLQHGRLLPGAIADRTQRGWVMTGLPMARVTSAGGRFVYTLYENPGGFPFVHALDTVRGVARCVGIPWTGDQTAIGTMRLALLHGGRTLQIAGASPRSFTVDTRTYAVSLPGSRPRHDFPWWTLALLAVPLLAVLVVGSRRWAVRTWAPAAGASA